MSEPSKEGCGWKRAVLPMMMNLNVSNSQNNLKNVNQHRKLIASYRCSS
jgi:hypothetical protein